MMFLTRMEVMIMAIKKDGVGNDRLTFRAQAFQPGGCDCDTPGYEDEVGNDNVVDLSCSDSVKVLRTLPMELTDEERDMVKGYLKISDITRAYIAANGHLFIVMNDGTERDVGDARGIPGDTPEFGDNGNWFIGGKDTGVPATGPQGDAPYIGENGNWWVSGKDLGIRTGKPKLGDIMESLQHPGAGWVACDDGLEAPGTPLYDALPYNTEWRKVPTEKAGLPQATAFKPLPVAGQWYYMKKYTGSGGYGDEAFVYDANTDTFVTFDCPSVSNATKSYGMTGLTHDGDRYVLCVAEMQISASMTGVTHFFASTNLKDWNYQASFNARGNGYFATDLYFDGTYLLVIEHYGYGEQQEYAVRFDKSLSTRTEISGIGTESHSFIALPFGYWSYATTSDKHVNVRDSGSITSKFIFSAGNNLGRVAFFNDRYWFGLPVSGSLSTAIQIADLTTNKTASLSVSTATGGRAGLLDSAEYDPNANEWVLYTKDGTANNCEVRISADSDPTKASSYKATPVATLPATRSYEQMKPDRSQMGLSSDSYRILRDPNLKYRPKSGDNPHYIYAGVGGEAIVAPSMYAVDADAVHYYSDDVTDAQRARARENIGAASSAELNTLREDVDQRIANVPKFSTLVVESLPLQDVSDTTVYLVPTGDGDDLYTEYINVDGKWEKLGTQTVLSVPGEKGDDGITPHIGENGNWFIGEVDTGKPSRGEKGDPGDDYVLTEGDKTEIAEMAAGKLQPGIDELSEAIVKMDDSKADAIVETATGEVLALTDAADAPIRGLVVYGKSTQDGTPTPDAPVPIVSAFEDGGGVGAYGANLCSEMLALSPAVSVSDGVATQIATDTKSTFELVIQATNNFEFAKFIMPPTPIRTVGRYSGSFVKDDSFNTIVFGHNGAVNDIKCKMDVGHLVNGETYTLSLEITNVVQGTFSWRKVQLNIGSTALPYEPYKPVQTLYIAAPLCGIHVESGGNYTDRKGQQWVCDEIDFVRGVKVQRVGEGYITNNSKIGIDNTEKYPGRRYVILSTPSIAITSAIMSDSLTYNHYNSSLSGLAVENAGISLSATKNDVLYFNIAYMQSEDTVEATKEVLAQYTLKYVYALKTPIETPLTEEELAAYRALQTNYPNTTIYADDNAGLSVDYKADTKLYIDKKFAELAAAIVNN
jgi:hypothetical protein